MTQIYIKQNIASPTSEAYFLTAALKPLGISDRTNDYSNFPFEQHLKPSIYSLLVYGTVLPLRKRELFEEVTRVKLL